MLLLNNHLLSLLLLGSLVPFSQAVGKQHLRRKASQELSTPIERRSIDFNFIVLEFGNNIFNSQDHPYVNGTQFVDTYNSLVTCRLQRIYNSLAEFDGITNSSEFMPRAQFLEEESSTDVTRVLIQVDGFIDWDFFDETSEVAENIEVRPDCQGPKRQNFVTALATNLGLNNLKNATQIPLLNPSECDYPTYSYEGICPGRSNRVFSFFKSAPSETPQLGPQMAPPMARQMDPPTVPQMDPPTVPPTSLPNSPLSVQHQVRPLLPPRHPAEAQQEAQREVQLETQQKAPLHHQVIPLVDRFTRLPTQPFPLQRVLHPPLLQRQPRLLAQLLTLLEV